ncbi:MAG: hypothetical protein KatS3mg112_0298 [Thermogutta sp.]|nr:MAG: hypothetical protein KatS3mg112_0298 [Thermogutta sp.]
MTLAEELERLHRLHEAGALTDEEFAAAKARLLSESSGDQKSSPIAGWRLRERLQDGRFWAMLLHLSLLLNITLPGFALVVPFLIWQLGKDRFPELDTHGKNAANFVMSYLIYGACVALVGFVLSLIPLGITLALPLWYGFAAVLVLCVFYVAWQANQGRLVKYPLAIPFFV